MLTSTNQFDVSDAVLNLQSLQSFKANIYSVAFESQLSELSNSKISPANGIKQTQAQRESLRFVGDLLELMPDLQAFALFREFYKERSAQDKQLDLYNGI